MYTCELVRILKRSRHTFQCIFDTVAIYLTVLEEEQHKKIYRDIYNTKNMQHFSQPRFLRNMLRKNTCLPLF